MPFFSELKQKHSFEFIRILEAGKVVVLLRKDSIRWGRPTCVVLKRKHDRPELVTRREILFKRDVVIPVRDPIKWCLCLPLEENQGCFKNSNTMGKRRYNTKRGHSCEKFYRQNPISCFSHGWDHRGPQIDLRQFHPRCLHPSGIGADVSPIYDAAIGWETQKKK